MEPTWLDIYINAVQANAAMPLPDAALSQPVPYPTVPTPPMAPPPQPGIMVGNEQAIPQEAQSNLSSLTSTGVPNG